MDPQIAQLQAACDVLAQAAASSHTDGAASASSAAAAAAAAAWEALLTSLGSDEPVHRALALRGLDSALEIVAAPAPPSNSGGAAGALGCPRPLRRRLLRALAEVLQADELDANRREAALLLGKITAIFGGGTGADAGSAATTNSASMEHTAASSHSVSAASSAAASSSFAAASSSAAAPAVAAAAAAVSPSTDAAWCVSFAYPLLKSFLASSLPALQARLLLGDTHAHGHGHSHQPSASFSASYVTGISTAYAGGARPVSSKHGVHEKASSLSGRISSATASATPTTAPAAVAASSTAAAAASALDDSQSAQLAAAATLVVALESFGYLLDSAPASPASESARVDDLLLALLSQPDLDVFVRSEVLCVLSQQLRLTHRNRRRVAKMMPAIKRIMGGNITAASAATTASATAATALPAPSALGSASASSSTASPSPSPSLSPSPAVGATSHNVDGSPDLLHPYLRRCLCLFVSVWYCLPPDRLLRRFPTPDMMLAGYAARQYAKLAGAGAVATAAAAAASASGEEARNRRQSSAGAASASGVATAPPMPSQSHARTGSQRALPPASSPSHHAPSSSVGSGLGSGIGSGLSELGDSYSMWDSDTLGWASQRGIDALLQDLAKWATRRSMASASLSAADAEASAAHTAGAETKVVPKIHRHSKARGSADSDVSSSGTLQRSPASSLSLGSSAPSPDDCVNELLSQWADVTFNLRADVALKPQKGLAVPPTPIVLDTPSVGGRKGNNKHQHAQPATPLSPSSQQLLQALDYPALPSADGSVVPSVSPSMVRASYCLEFDARQCVRHLTLSNKSARFAHDFFLQLSPPCSAFRVEPAWGTLEAGSSRRVTISFQPSPLDRPGTVQSAFIRVRSAQGFAMERVELRGWSGAGVRILNASAASSSSALSIPASLSPHPRLSAVASSSSSSILLSHAAACGSLVDFGVCTPGQASTRFLYLQNIGHSSTQVQICYMHAGSKSRKQQQTPKQQSMRDSTPPFAVIPSLLFLRPHETKRVSIVFYPVAVPAALSKKHPAAAARWFLPHDHRLAIFGQGEERYELGLKARAGIVVEVRGNSGSGSGAGSGVSAEPALDFGPVELFKGSLKELTKELNAREAREMQSAALNTTALNSSAHGMPPSATAAASSTTSRAASSPSSVAGLYTDHISITNHSPSQSLVVSFRYNGQQSKHVSLSGGEAEQSAAGSNWGGIKDPQECDTIIVRDTVVPPASVQRVAVTFLAQHAGSFSKRLYINTPCTPTDSLSVLLTAHVGPLLRVGDCATINLPPVAVNTAAHHVIPIVNLSKLALQLQIQGLQRTPMYAVLSRMPLTLNQHLSAKELKSRRRTMKRASLTEDSSISTAAAAALAPEELHELFDPVGTATCALPHMGRDFLPAPVAFADVSTRGLATLSTAATGVVIRPFETLLMHVWFLSHLPGFYSAQFQLRATGKAAARGLASAAAVMHTYGPVEIKALCMARSVIDPPLSAQGATEGAAAAAISAYAPQSIGSHAPEDPANLALLSRVSEALRRSGMQYRADAASLSLQALRHFSALSGTRGLQAFSGVGADKAGAHKSFLSEHVATPSDRWDREMREYVLPPQDNLIDEGEDVVSSSSASAVSATRRASLLPGAAGSPGVNYPLYKLPNGSSFQSTLLKLPPRLWLWRRKTLLLQLTNLSPSPQSFLALLSSPFHSELVSEIDLMFEVDRPVVGDSTSLDTVRGHPRYSRPEAPNRVAGGRSTKIDVALLQLEEFAGQQQQQLQGGPSAKHEAEMAKFAALAAEREQKEYEARTQQYGSGLVHSRALQSAQRSSPNDEDELSLSQSSHKQFRAHSLAVGFLAVIDSSNHLVLTRLCGLLGDLVSVETAPQAMVFTCTTIEGGANAAAATSAMDAEGLGSGAVGKDYSSAVRATPVTLYLKLLNHTDLTIQFGLSLGGHEVLSSTQPTLHNHFSITKPLQGWSLAAYETQFVPVSFAPRGSKLGRFHSELVLSYRNPYNPAERFEAWKATLEGNYLRDDAVELESSAATAAVSSMMGGPLGLAMAAAGPLSPGGSSGASANSTESQALFVDCGTILLSDASSSGSASPPPTKEIPFTVHNNSALELTVSANGCAPFFVAGPEATPNANNNATAVVAAAAQQKGRGPSASPEPEESQHDASSSLVGSEARRKQAWADRRAARLRLKSGSSYAIDDSSDAGSSSALAVVGKGLRAAPVTQLLTALNSVNFRILFRPSLLPSSSLGGGAFSAQITLAFLHYFKLIDVFGVAGQLALSSNWGPPSAVTDMSQKQNDASVAAATTAATSNADNGNSNALASRSRLGGGVGMGGGPARGHSRDLSMPTFSHHAAHARNSSMTSFTNAPTAAVAASAAPAAPTVLPIDLGLSPLNRRVTRAFTLTNSGSMPIYISRIQILNGSAGSNASVSVGMASLAAPPRPTNAAPMSLKDGGMSWSFAHTTVTHSHAASSMAAVALPSILPIVHGIATASAKEVRIHTLAAGAGGSTGSGSPALNVHARTQLSATMLKANTLTNMQRRRQRLQASKAVAAPARRGRGPSKAASALGSSIARNIADGFAVDDLEAQCIDWDEVDYQVQLATAASNPADAQNAATMAASRLPPPRKPVAQRDSDDEGESGADVDSNDESADLFEDLSSLLPLEDEDPSSYAVMLARDADLPLVLPVGHSLPLTLTWFKERSGLYAHELHISCFDPNAAAAASGAVGSSSIGGAFARPGAGQAPKFIGPSMVALLAASDSQQQQQQGQKAAAFGAGLSISTGPSASALVAAAAQGDFSGFSSSMLRAADLKRFEFLLHVGAQAHLKIDASSKKLLNFGVVKVQQPLQQQSTAAASAGMMSPVASVAAATLVYPTPALSSGSYTKRQSFSFVNEGSIPLSWRLVKTAVRITRTTKEDAEAWRDEEEASVGDAEEAGDTVGPSADSSEAAAPSPVDLLPEQPHHASAFVLHPAAGTLQPKHRQVVSVAFLPSQAHLKYSWVVQLVTNEMGATSSSSSAAETQASCVRLQGIAGGALLQLLTIDEVFGIERVLPASASVASASQELAFGSISLGCDRHKTLLLRNDGEIASRFELSTSASASAAGAAAGSSLAAHQSPFMIHPMQGVVGAHSQLELAVVFTPARAHFVSQNILVRWGADVFGAAAIAAAVAAAAAATANEDEDESAHRQLLESELAEPPLRLLLTGKGGLSELKVLDSSFDFGTVTFGQEQTILLRIHNHGVAEGQAFIDLSPAATAVAGATEDEEAQAASAVEPQVRLKYPEKPLFVLPGSFVDVALVFRPTIVAPLSLVARVHAQGPALGPDSSSSPLLLVASPLLVGHVGVPNLVVYPEGVLDHLDFGTCLRGTSRSIELTLANRGNVDLRFEVAWVRIKRKSSVATVAAAAATAAKKHAKAPSVASSPAPTKVRRLTLQGHSISGGGSAFGESGGLEQLPSLTRVRHTGPTRRSALGSHHAPSAPFTFVAPSASGSGSNVGSAAGLLLQSLFAQSAMGGVGPGNTTHGGNDEYYEDHLEALEECAAPPGVSVFPGNGRIKAAPAPVAAPGSRASTGLPALALVTPDNSLKLTLTFSPTEALQSLDCAMLIRSTHAARPSPGDSVLSRERHERADNLSGFDTIYSLVRGLGGDPKLVLDSPSRFLDFGAVRVGSTVTKTLRLTNPGNIKVDFHLGPDLRSEAEGGEGGYWADMAARMGQQQQQQSAFNSPTLVPMTGDLQQQAFPMQLHSGASSSPGSPPLFPRRPSTNASVPPSSASASSAPLDYTSLRRLWLESLLGLGFDFVSSGECLPGRSTTLTIVYTPRDESHVKVPLRIVSNAQSNLVLELEGRGAQSRLHLLRSKNIKLAASLMSAAAAGGATGTALATAAGTNDSGTAGVGMLGKFEVDAIDFGLLPIISAATLGGGHSSGGSGGGSVSAAGSPYRKLFWLFNSGRLDCDFHLASSALPPEFRVDPCSGRVASGAFMPLSISFAPTKINHAVAGTLRFMGSKNGNAPSAAQMAAAERAAMEREAAEKAALIAASKSKATGGGAASSVASPTPSTSSTMVPSTAAAVASAAGPIDLFSALSVPLRGSGGFGLLGVTFLTPGDARWSGLDFDIVSVHHRHSVEKYFSIYNCGSVAIRVKIEVDSPAYALGVAGGMSALSMQIAGVVTNTPVDETAVANEIRYNAKLHKFNTTNTHYLLGSGGGGGNQAASAAGGRTATGKTPALGRSAFDYEERPDGMLEKTSRASVLTYLLSGSGDPDAAASRSRRGSKSTVVELPSPTHEALAGLGGLGLIPSLPSPSHKLEGQDLIDVTTDASALSPSGAAGAGKGGSTSLVTSNAFTAQVAGSQVIEELLPPGKYLPIFVRVLVALEKSYLATVLVSSEHRFVSIPVRAEGGVVSLSHQGSLDFGTIGCFHRYTKTIVLRNSGTVPTRAKLFWHIRGNGQAPAGFDGGAASLLALSGAKPMENPYILEPHEMSSTSDSDDEKEEETADAEQELEGLNPDGTLRRPRRYTEAEKAARAKKIARKTAARLKRRQAREQRRKDAAQALLDSPTLALDTYKSVLRLYAKDDAPPAASQVSIVKLWWQHCIKFIRVLLRSYKMMYPARSKKLFANQGAAGLGLSASAEAAAIAAAVEKEYAEKHKSGLHQLQQRTAKPTGAHPSADSRSLTPSQPPSRPREDSPSKQPASLPGASSGGGGGGAGGLEDYLAEVESKKLADEELKARALAEAEEEARLASQQAKIKQALLKVAAMDPNLREHIGPSGSAGVDQSVVDSGPSIASPAAAASSAAPGLSLPSSLDVIAAVQPADAVDADIGLAPSHPMYASARALAQKGRTTDLQISELVARVEHRRNEGENPALQQLLAAAAKLNLKMAHQKLPRIGDPGDGVVDMRTADSADRIPQLRLSPGTILLGKDSRVEITVDLNVPQAGAFNATLVVECELSGVERYEIPLRARAAQVNALFDDHSCLDFGRIALGSTELRTRTLTNMGSIAVKFRVQNDNPSLVVEPMEGVVQPGRRKPFAFSFRAVDESVQNAPIRIFTNCTPPLLLGVFGAGGIPKLHIDCAERLDFGRCMLGKSQTRLITLTNTGNANLPIVLASIEDAAGVFSKGLRAQAEKDELELLHPGAAAAKALAAAAAGPASKLARIPSEGKRNTGRKTARGLLLAAAAAADSNQLQSQGPGQGSDATFGLTSASLAHAAAPRSRHSKAQRSLYVPAGALLGGGGKDAEETKEAGSGRYRALVLPSARSSKRASAAKRGGDSSDSDDDDRSRALRELHEDDEEDDDDDDSDLESMLSSASRDPVASLDSWLSSSGTSLHDWPRGKVTIPPGESFTLALQFVPPSEDVFTARLLLETSAQSHHITLVGTGREALLVYDQKMLDFQECLVGNAYTKSFSLMNVGEVTYPVRLILQDKNAASAAGTDGGEKGGAQALSAALQAVEDASSPDFIPDSALSARRGVHSLLLPSASRQAARPISNVDLKVSPQNLVLSAFEKATITVTFTPTRELRASARLILDSIYSQNSIAVHMGSGTASLELSTTAIDFGMVQQGSRVAASIVLKNTGSLGLGWRIKPPASAGSSSSRLKGFAAGTPGAGGASSLPFNFSKWSGSIPPRSEVEIICRATLVELGSFHEELCIETDRIGQRSFFTVRATTAKSVLDASKFREVYFGPCAVGEPRNEIVVVHNEGGYPLDFSMKANSPLSISPLAGQIRGGAIQAFQVQWIPTGGYDLSQLIHMSTNIGVFDILCKGSGCYPRFVLRHAQIDFGVCAIGHAYTRVFRVLNKGKVGINWSIPRVDSGYSCAPSHGVLSPGEEDAVTLTFKASRVGLYASNFIVECCGRYREVNVVGVGGILSLDYPESVDLQAVACGQWSSSQIEVKNTGDVTLHAQFKLDRESIDAEPNTDDELDGKQDADEDATQQLSLTVKHDRDGRPRPSTGGAQIELINEDDEKDEDASSSTAIVSQSRPSSRAPCALSTRRPAGARTPFAIKVSPSGLVIPPRSSGQVSVRCWVPPRAEGLFQFRLKLQLPEAVLPLYFSGTGTVVRLSNFARALCVSDAEAVLAVVRAPHVLAPTTAMASSAQSRGLSTQQMRDLASSLSAGLEHVWLSPSSLSHARLAAGVSVAEYRRQQLRLLERVSRRLRRSVYSQEDSDSDLEGLQRRLSVQRPAPQQIAAALVRRGSLDGLASESLGLIVAATLDPDVVVAAQVLDTMVAALSLALEHRSLLHVDSPSDSDFAETAAAAAAAPSSDSLSSSALVSRDLMAPMPADLLCLPHAPHSVARALQAMGGGDDSGTGRGVRARQQQAAEAAMMALRADAGTPSLESLESRRSESAAAASASSDLGSAFADLDSEEDHLVGVCGVTHAIDLAAHTPLTTGVDDVVCRVLQCAPQLPVDLHTPLLRYIEPTHNRSYLAILPELLREPPEFLIGMD